VENPRNRTIGEQTLEKDLAALPKEIKDRVYAIMELAIKNYTMGINNKFDLGEQIAFAIELAWEHGFPNPRQRQNDRMKENG